MDLSILFFISSGIFLGWSLGANHAANVFGTAVMSKMVKYRAAAIVAGICVTCGAVFGGAGTTRTLNELGAVNALAGSFTVALAVGIAVAWMTYLKLPVSTSQAIVGGVIGWNLFTGSPTDAATVAKILGTWITSPILAALFAFLLFRGVHRFVRRARIHMLEIDAYTRTGFLVIGAIASYVLGANNIANVMGLFVAAAPFGDLSLGGGWTFTGTQQLFLIGGLAIASGIYTYGQKVMVTVGNDLYRITPLSGLVVVTAQSIVLFLFSSQDLESLLRFLHLPTFPLVPLSSTQAVIGAVLGVGLAKQGRGINTRILGRIAAGWVAAPLTAFLLTFVILFFVQNVFEQRVIADSQYQISDAVITAVGAEGVPVDPIRALVGRTYGSPAQLRSACEGRGDYSRADENIILRLARIDSLLVDSVKVEEVLGAAPPPEGILRALRGLHGEVFLHPCDLEEKLRSTILQSDSTTLRLIDGVTRRQLDSLVAALRTTRH